MRNMGPQAYHPHKKKLQMSKMHGQRLNWGKEHVDWNVNMWDSFTFLHETKFNLHRSDNKPYVSMEKMRPLTAIP